MIKYVYQFCNLFLTSTFLHRLHDFVHKILVNYVLANRYVLTVCFNFYISLENQSLRKSGKSRKMYSQHISAVYEQKVNI